MTQLAQHDREALLEQAAHKTALASDVRVPRDPAWREHLADAIEAYERAGYQAKADDVRALLATPAAKEEPAKQAAAKPEADADGVSKPAKHGKR